MPIVANATVDFAQPSPPRDPTLSSRFLSALPATILAFSLPQPVGLPVVVEGFGPEQGRGQPGRHSSRLQDRLIPANGLVPVLDGSEESQCSFQMRAWVALQTQG